VFAGHQGAGLSDQADAPPRCRQGRLAHLEAAPVGLVAGDGFRRRLCLRITDSLAVAPLGCDQFLAGHELRIGRAEILIRPTFCRHAGVHRAQQGR